MSHICYLRNLNKIFTHSNMKISIICTIILASHILFCFGFFSSSVYFIMSLYINICNILYNIILWCVYSILWNRIDFQSLLCHSLTSIILSLGRTNRIIDRKNSIYKSKITIKFKHIYI